MSDRKFACSAVVLIGLGVGLAAAMFALLDAVGLRKLDVPDPDSLIVITAMKEGRADEIPYALFQRLRQDPDIGGSLCATSSPLAPVTFRDRTIAASMLLVEGDYYGIFHARLIAGRTLSGSDDMPLAVISDAFMRRLGRNKDVVGEAIQAGPVPLTITGVVPAGAHEQWRFVKTDMVVPFRVGMRIMGESPESLPLQEVVVVGRLKEGQTLEEVQAKLDALWPSLLAATIPAGDNLESWMSKAGRRIKVSSGARGLSWSDNSLPRAALALFALAGLVLLAMCSNLAGLLLSRGLGRRMEYAIRMALGATRGDLLRRALAEVLVLSALGGGAALLLAAWLVPLCSRALDAGKPTGLLDVDYGLRIDVRVTAFALVAALAVALAAQVLAAVRFSKLDVGNSLRLGRATASPSPLSRKVIVALQVAAATILVCGSVLFIRTSRDLSRVEGGFDPADVLVVTLAGKVPYTETGPEYYRELLKRVRAIPSVSAAGLGDRAPMESDYDANEPVRAPNTGAPEVRSDSACVWPGFFAALKIPVTSGRDFRDSDRNAVVLSRQLARDLFPGGNPLGRYVHIGKAPDIKTRHVIGVVGDARFRSARQKDERMFFLSCRDEWKLNLGGSLVIRMKGARGEVEPAVRREIDAMGRHAVFKTALLEALRARSNWKESILARIATLFGAFTLVFTCVGVYALIRLSAAARRRELGIRMALGAERRSILELVLKDILRIVAVGVGSGLITMVMFAPLYRRFLFDVTAFEPSLLAASLGIVLFCALGAALLPAWRAARLDPCSILRADGK